MGRWVRVVIASALTFAVAGAAVQAAVPVLSGANPKASVVYGEDDRREIFQIENARDRLLADSAVALFWRWGVSVDSSQSVARLHTQRLKDRYNVCESEPFSEQPSGSRCSGFLVAPDLVATAGHCIRSWLFCTLTRVVFGFYAGGAGDFPLEVPSEEVYSCKRIVARHGTKHGSDFALIQLDRPVKGHAPLELDRSGEGVREGEPVFVIGNALGLPAKYAAGARIRDVSFSTHFIANLDTYSGNSGSAVFSARSGKVLGILADGEADFNWTENGCKLTRKCAVDGCRGEEVTRITELTSWVSTP